MKTKYPKDLTGMRFGRLVALRVAKKTGEGCANDFWSCKCDCGNEVVVRRYGILSWNTRSCGCLSKDVHKKQRGLSHDLLYKKWMSMKRRCYDSRSLAYKNYGGRGIKVCDEWREHFIVFYEWCISSGYVEGNGKSLDRIDNDGDYSPDNCRWVDYKDQQNNKRRSRFVTFDGKTLTVAQWERETGISRSTIIGRLNRGWTAEKALTEKDGISLVRGGMNDGQQALDFS